MWIEAVAHGNYNKSPYNMLRFELKLSSVPSVSSINSDPPPEQLASKQGVTHKPPEVKQPAYVKIVHQH